MSDDEIYGKSFKRLHAATEKALPQLAETVLGGLYLQCYCLIVSQLQHDRSVSRVLTIAREMEEMHEKTAGMVTDMVKLPQYEEPQQVELACKKGCAYCCHIRLTSTPLEVIALGERLRADGRTDSALEKLRSYEQAIEGLTPEKRLVTLMPCPFLASDLCTVYDIRPSACRAYHSYDLGRCIADFEKPEEMLGVPQNPVRLDIDAMLFDAVEQACLELRLENETIEFVTGVRLVLEDPNLVSRWLDGEDCFADAVDFELMDYAAQSREKMNAKSQP